jgi:ABC-type transport system involved in Fe-S cluster assembly, permease component
VNSIITKSEQLFFTEDTLQRIEISNEEAMTLDLEIQEKVKASVYLIYKKNSGKIKLNIQLQEDSSLSLFSWNDNEELLEVEEAVYFADKSKFNVSYGELGLFPVIRKANYYIKGKFAELKTCLAAIANEKKEFVLHAIHEETDGSSDMKNYAIIPDGAEFYLDVTGKIIKGSHRSNATQNNRILTLSENHKAVVLPQLLIDDNDVIAGHAMTMGQIDENQLYYMESRGMPKNMALQLVTLGYLTPIAYLFTDDQREEILTWIEEKVSAQCLISTE